jgi:hypothetical protein
MSREERALLEEFKVERAPHVLNGEDRVIGEVEGK